MNKRRWAFAAAVSLAAGGASWAGAAVSAQEGSTTDENTPCNERTEVPFCFRFAGWNRYETAAMTEGIEYTQGPMLVFANANGIDAFFIADNLAMKTALGNGPAWMLPVPAEGPVPQVILDAISDYTDIEHVAIIGGRNAVSDEVAQQVVRQVVLGAGPGL